MIISRGLTLCVLFLSLTSCTNPINISSDFNENIDFSTFTTYQWHEGNEYNLASKQYLANDIIDLRIRTNVDRELRQKGLYLQESNTADFLVNYSVSTQEKIDIDTYNSYAGYAPGWSYPHSTIGPYSYGSPFGYSTGTQETRIRQYSQGTLVLDIIQPETNLLIWRGTADGKLNPSMSQAERETIVGEVITRLLSSFPPQ